jgi:hypothetical protein
LALEAISHLTGQGIASILEVRSERVHSCNPIHSNVPCVIPSVFVQKAEQAALGAEVPPFATYPERGKVGIRARERNAYRLLQSLRYQQVYTVMMDAIEDVCNVDVPAVRSAE